MLVFKNQQKENSKYEQEKISIKLPCILFLTSVFRISNGGKTKTQILNSA